MGKSFLTPCGHLHLGCHCPLSVQQPDLTDPNRVSSVLMSVRVQERQKEQALVIAALKGAGIFNIGVTKNISNKVMLCHRFQTKRHENQ